MGLRPQGRKIVEGVVAPKSEAHIGVWFYGEYSNVVLVVLYAFKRRTARCSEPNNAETAIC